MSRSVTMRRAAQAREKEEALIAQFAKQHAPKAEGVTTQEVDDIEYEVFDPTQAIKDLADVPTNDNIFDEPAQESQHIPQPDPIVQPGQEDFRAKWLEEKGRNNSQKSKYDRNIFNARQEVQLLREENVGLKSKLIELNATAAQTNEGNKFNSVFTKEVTDVLGVDTVNALRSVVERLDTKVSDLQVELNEKDITNTKRQSQADKNSAHTSFMASLANLVPDCEAININKDFITWLGGETITGANRFDLMIGAKNRGDVERVASFFTDWKKEQKVTPTSKAVTDTIANHSGPVGTGNGDQGVSKPTPAAQIVTMADIHKFGQDIARHRYKGRESERDVMQARIDHAYKHNLIR